MMIHFSWHPFLNMVSAWRTQLIMPWRKVNNTHTLCRKNMTHP